MSTGQALGAVAGGVIGAFVGGPAGALQGATWGAALGGVLDPPKGPTVQGPRLSDLTWQQSSYGANIPRVYGTVALAGNVVWLEHNKLKEVVKKKKSGGKGGGGGTTTKTYTYFATFALMLCQGEVAGVRRIWCGDKLIYNAGSDDLETIIASNQAAKGWKLYTGTDDQLPDPRYEADVGVGNAPAFRGYTYIAFYDFALADYSNTLQAAQFKVELLTEMSLGDPELQSNSALSGIVYPIFQSSSGIASCRTYVSSGGDYAIYDHFLGRKQYMGIQSRTGYGGDSPRRVVGASQSALVSDDKSTFLIDGKPYSTTKLGAGWFYFDIAYDQGNDSVYILAQSSTSRKLVAITPDGEFQSAFTDILSISLAGPYVYGIRTGSLVTLSAEDLSTVSTVTISPHYAIPAGPWVYIQVLDENLYLFPYVNETIINSKALQIFDVATGALLSVVDNFPGATYVSTLGAPSAIYDGVIVQCAVTGSTPGINMITFDQVLSEKPTLASIIQKETSLSGLIQPGDIDASLLTQQVTGYRVSGGTIRSVIEPLQGAYPFDVVPSGYKIKFVPRGQSPVMTIPWEDLAATDGTDIGDSLPYSREMDSQLPQKVTITALSSTREYASVTQSSPGRPSTSAVNIEQREIPLVLSDDEVAQMAEKLEFLRWLERDDFDFSLPPTYLALEPADIVTVQAKFGTFELRQTDINYEQDGRLTCKAKANNAAIYTSNAKGAPGPGPSGTIHLSGPSLLIPLDIPSVDETVQNTAGFVSAMTGYSSGWPGGVMVRSADGGQTWSEVQGFAGQATIGRARGTLPVNGGTVISQRTLVVDLISGELESITRDQLIAGQNYAAYGVDGRWEIVRFQTATLQTDGSYLLTGFVRGDRGTEWATGLHQAADLFVLLDDPDNAFVGMAVASIGISSTLRGVTSGAGIDSATDIPFTYKGVNLECLSPVNAHGYRDTSGNFSGTFNRRSRLSSSWWTTGVPAPIGETSTSYEIDVMSGSTVKRTITATSSAWSYSAANQVTDFGSAQSSITFRIYQLSSVVGRGYPLEVTL